MEPARFCNCLTERTRDRQAFSIWSQHQPSELSLRGYNALHLCAIYARPNSAEIASKLIGRSRKLVNFRSPSGYTALHFAAVVGSVPLMNTLAAGGAHLIAASNFVTPLGLAIVYWSELRVEEMCNIHMKKRVPLVI